MLITAFGSGTCFKCRFSKKFSLLTIFCSRFFGVAPGVILCEACLGPYLKQLQREAESKLHEA